MVIEDQIEGRNAKFNENAYYRFRIERLQRQKNIRN